MAVGRRRYCSRSCRSGRPAYRRRYDRQGSRQNSSNSPLRSSFGIFLISHASLIAAPCRATMGAFHDRQLRVIRDRRIACKDGFRDAPEHVRHQRFAACAFPRRLRAWRERNNLSQSEAALKLQISKRTLQEWEQDRAAPRGFAQTAIEKITHA